VDVVGVSTVGGNAPRGIVDLTTAALLEQFGLGALLKNDVRAALEQGPLTILALGPLTNIAALLHEEPELRKNVARLIAVMGRRPGHIFHPAEGADGGMLFGHGPVFRDFNFALDPDAVSRVLALNVPISFVPYDATRGIELTAEDLDRLKTSLPWIVERSRGWLDYWRSSIGRAGFAPFDLLAAAYVIEPSLLRCVPVRAWVGEDDTLFLPWSPEALLVEPDADGAALYCGRARDDAKERIMRFFRRADRVVEN
jgi:inosine-uridine nucleoside N-ribohydrolase